MKKKSIFCKEIIQTQTKPKIKLDMKKLLYLFLVVSSISAFSQSPWTQEKGKAYVQLSYTTIPSYSELFGDPAYPTERKINDNTLQLYVEYGISDKTTLIGNLPFKMVSSNDLVQASTITFTTEDSQAALGNIQLGIKHNFYKKEWLISGQLLVEANTGTYEEASGLRTGYDAWTFTPLISVGHTYNKWYMQAYTGVDIRTNDYSSNFKFGGEIGNRVKDWLILTGFIDFSASFENGDVLTPVNNALTGLYVNDQSYYAFGVKLIGEFSENFGATFGFGGAFGGTNVAKAPALSLGFYHKL